MKITIGDELKRTWDYEPKYSVSVEGDFSQKQVLQIRAAVDTFIKKVRPILSETKSERNDLPSLDSNASTTAGQGANDAPKKEGTL